MHRLRYEPMTYLVWRAELGPHGVPVGCTAVWRISLVASETYSRAGHYKLTVQVLNHTTRLPCSQGSVAHHPSTDIKHT